MQNQALRFFSFLLVSSALFTSASAQQGQIIKDINVQYDGPASVSKEAILANVSTKVGNVFDRDVINEDIKSLYSSGNINNASVFTESYAGGIRLIFVVETRAALRAVRFMGNEKVTDHKLRKEVRDTIGEGSFDDAKLEEARQEILKVYAKKGFSDVTVGYRIDQSEGNLSDVVFVIDEGERGRLRSVQFEGVTAAKPEELRGAMQTKEKKFWRPFGKYGKINNRELESDILRIEDFLKDRGYLNAEVVDLRKERIDDEEIDLVFVVNEGQRYDVGSVGISGVTLTSTDGLAAYLQQNGGSVYNGSAVKADLKMIRDFYGRQGYADARVTPRLTSGGTNVVNIDYMVYEGDKFKVGMIHINGNEITKDKVIRRELLVLPGDELDTVSLEASESKINGLGYFERVEVNMTDSPVPQHKDISISVREKPTGTINFGAGFSSIDNLVGFVDIVQTNFDHKNPPKFTGGGDKFRMSLKFGASRKDFVVNHTNPWFLDRQLAFGKEAYFNEYRFFSDQYDQRRMGAAVSLRKPFGRDSYLKLENRVQQWELFRVASEASEEIKKEEGKYFQNLIGLTYVWDTRDSMLLPRRGHKFEAGVDFSVGDIQTYGFDISGIKYLLLPGDIIISTEANLSTIDNYSGDRVPLVARKFLGGANNVRSQDFREVGPRDVNGEPLGGETSFFASIEATAPLFRKTRIATFADLGSIGSNSFDFGNTSHGVGVGLRLFLPIGPIRLDYAVPTSDNPFEDTSGRFNFTMGVKF